MAFKRGGKNKGGGRSGKGRFLRVLLLLVLLAGTLAAVFFLLILRPYENQPLPAKVNKVSHLQERGGAPPNRQGAEAPGQKGSAAESIPMQGAAVRGGKELPRLAIVIDDMGYQPQLDAEMLRLDLNLSFAFLPYGPKTGEEAARAERLGRDVLLHLPMEPTDLREDPGPGALTLATGAGERAEIFARDLARVPMAVGVNNHMGSHFTADRAAMRDFLGLLRDRHLFFLDSLTSRESLGYLLAQEMGVKSCRRQVFLDNDQDQARIIAQLRVLLADAERQGQAVGIGHPHPQTLAALRAAAPEILSRVQLVGVSHLAQ